MSVLSSLASEKFRKAFLVFYALSSIVPMLILMYMLFHYVYPLLSEKQIQEIVTPFTFVLVAMLVLPIFGLAMMYRWIKFLEKLTAEVREKSAEMIGNIPETINKNEMVTLKKHFDGLYNELHDKIAEINEYSHQLIESHVKLSEQAVKDKLTTLYNRHYFDLRLEEEVSRAERYQAPLALILMDVDGFKDYNDAYGHPAGDKLLRELGSLIQKLVRKSDIPCRYGGDEFTVILPESDAEKAEAVARKLADEVALHTFRSEDEAVAGKISLSCGVVQYKAQGAEGFVLAADHILYEAKSMGRGQVVARQ